MRCAANGRSMRARTPISSRTLITSEVLSSPLGVSLSCRARTRKRVTLPGRSWMLRASTASLYVAAARLLACADGRPCVARFLDGGDAGTVRGQPLATLRKRLRVRDHAAQVG